MKEINSKELQYVSGGGILPWPFPNPSVPTRNNPSTSSRRYQHLLPWWPVFL